MYNLKFPNYVAPEAVIGAETIIEEGTIILTVVLRQIWWYLFFISMVFLFFFLNPIKSCRYVCFLVTLKTPHH